MHSMWVSTHICKFILPLFLIQPLFWVLAMSRLGNLHEGGWNVETQSTRNSRDELCFLCVMCIGKAHVDRCIPKIITAWVTRSELQFWQSQLEKFLCWKSMNPTWSLLQAVKVWYFRRCNLFRSNLKGFFFFVCFVLFVCFWEGE